MFWLVVEPTPLKNMSSSVGIMKFPTEWKNKKGSKPPIRCFSTVRTKTRVSLKKTKSGTEKNVTSAKKPSKPLWDFPPASNSDCMRDKKICEIVQVRCHVPCGLALKTSWWAPAMLTSLSSRWTIKCHCGDLTSDRSFCTSPLVSPVSMQFWQSQWVPGGSQRLMFVQLIKIN